MNIIRHEFKSNLKSFFIWTISVCLLFFVASFEFEMFQNNPAINQAFDDFGYIFDALGGISDMSTAEGYLALVSIYIYVPLGIYSALLGSRIISKEEQKRTAEYLFTLPVSRTKVITSKLVVAISYTIIIDILSMLVCLYSFGRFAESPETFGTFVFNLGLGVLFTQIIFLSIGLLLSSVLKNYKKSGGITVGFVIGTFMLSMLIGLAPEADILKYLTPFQYFPAAAMIEGEFNLVFILISIGIVITSITGLYFFYKKRDLRI